MAKTVGYLVTWTTYGTWLQGDKRGYVKKGEVLKGNERLQKVNKSTLSGGAVRLTKAERKAVEEAIVKEAEKWVQRIYAISVCSNHVHIVLGFDHREIGRSVRRYKNAGYFALRRRGRIGRIWTKGCDKRYCFDAESLRARVDYVRRHGGAVTAGG